MKYFRPIPVCESDEWRMRMNKSLSTVREPPRKHIRYPIKYQFQLNIV